MLTATHHTSPSKVFHHLPQYHAAQCRAPRKNLTSVDWAALEHPLKPLNLETEKVRQSRSHRKMVACLGLEVTVSITLR